MILIRRILFNFTEAFFLTLLFITPIKFGSLAGIPGVNPLFMETSFENFIFFPWADLRFSFLSGLVLLLSIFSVPNDESFNRKRVFGCALSWVALGAYSLLGWINSGIFIFALLQAVHLLGIGCFIMSGYLLSRDNRFFFSKVLSVIVTSGIIIILIGIGQYLSNYALMQGLIFEKINYQYSMQVVKSNNIENYIKQHRIIGTFINPNTFAGYILLIGPIIIWRLNKLLIKLQWIKRFRNKKGELVRLKTNKKYLANILLILSIAVLFGMLFLASSRGAFVAFILSVMFIFVATKLRWFVKVAIIGVLAIILTFLIISYGDNSFSSVAIQVRYDYYLSVIKLILKNPLFGSGWSGFYPEYMQLQTQINDVDVVPYAPYNFILSAAVHTGIIGMFLAVFVVLYPLLVGYKSLRNSFTSKNYICRATVVYFSYLSFLVHAFLDLNLQATALVVLAGVIAVILVSESRVKPLKLNNSTALFSRWLLAVYSIMTIFLSLLYREHCLKQRQLSFELEEINKRYVSGHLNKITKIQYKCIDELLSHYNWSPYPYINVAKMLLFTRNYDNAIKYLNKAEMGNKQLPEIYYYLAVAYHYKKDNEMAEKMLDKALELYPTSSKMADLESLNDYRFYHSRFPKLKYCDAQEKFYILK